ncbi:MAG: leucine-rich repeat protein, partial [Malacoplasma sp.]|nr:leucine-rich repeat protein [Malacoplasma sp.]
FENIVNKSALISQFGNLTLIDLLNTPIITILSIIKSIFEQSALNTPFYWPFIDADNLTNVTNLFAGCAKLQSIDLTKMPILGKIGSHFLYECETLTSLKFPVTWKINTFNTAFLSGCKNIKSLAFPKQWTITSSIASDFLRNCSSLENLDLPHDWVVSAVGANFLYKCSKLKSVDVSCLYSITEFADNFLAECSNLTKIERLPTLIYETKIGNNFCLNCKSLEEIDFTSIEMVESIGKSFMQGCEKIPLVDLTPMPRLLKDNVIGENFLYNCKNLTELKIATIPATAFVKNTYSFATDDQTSPMYKRPGIKIIGDHANELKIAFPNSNSAPYRKWQENLTITAKHGEDPIEQSTLVEVTDNDTIQFSISKGTSPAWSVNPEEGVSIDSSGKLTITTAPENEKVYRVTCICDEGVAEFNMILVKDDTPPIQKVNYIVFQNRKIVIEGALTQSDIDAMCTTGYDLIIKGTKYDKMDINEIYFNDIDSNVTTIGENFLFEIFYATSINIASFTNVKSIGNFCMQDCWEAKDVTLPEMWNVETIG